MKFQQLRMSYFCARFFRISSGVLMAAGDGVCAPMCFSIQIMLRKKMEEKAEIFPLFRKAYQQSM